MKIHALIEELSHRADSEDARFQTSGFSHHKANADAMRAAATELGRLLALMPPLPPLPPAEEVEAPGVGGAPAAPPA